MKGFFRAAFLTVFLCAFFIFGGCYLPDGTQMQGCNMQACNMQGCITTQVDMSGEYKFYSMSYEEDGMMVELKAGEKFMGSIVLTEDFMSITLYQDGSAKMVSAGETMNGGSWKKVDDSHVEITFEGSSETFVCDGKTMTIDQDGVKVVLKKK